MAEKGISIDATQLLQSNTHDLRNSTTEQKMKYFELEATDTPYIYWCNLDRTSGVKSRIFVFARLTCGSLRYMDIGRNDLIDVQRAASAMSSGAIARMVGPEKALMEYCKTKEGDPRRAKQLFAYFTKQYEAPNQLVETLRTPWYSDFTSVAVSDYYAVMPRPLDA